MFKKKKNTEHQHVTGEWTGCNSITDKYVQWNIRHTSPKFAVTKKSSIQGFTFLFTYHEGKPEERMRDDTESLSLECFDDILFNVN